MKLQPDRFDHLSVHASGPGWVSVAGQRHTRSLLLGAGVGVQPWGVNGFADLQPVHFEPLLQAQPELVIVGTGLRHRFVPPAWLGGFMQQRIGVEAMSTLAACRTYNILAGEGRRVLAALILEPDTAPSTAGR